MVRQPPCVFVLQVGILPKNGGRLPPFFHPPTVRTQKMGKLQRIPPCTIRKNMIQYEPLSHQRVSIAICCTNRPSKRGHGGCGRDSGCASHGAGKHCENEWPMFSTRHRPFSFRGHSTPDAQQKGSEMNKPKIGKNAPNVSRKVCQRTVADFPRMNFL